MRRFATIFICAVLTAASIGQKLGPLPAVVNDPPPAKAASPIVPLQQPNHLWGLQWEVRHGTGYGLGGERDKAGVTIDKGFPFMQGEGTPAQSITLDYDKVGKPAGVTCRTLMNGTGFGQAIVYIEGNPGAWGTGFGFGCWFYRDTPDTPDMPKDPVTGNTLKAELDAEWYLNDRNDPSQLKPGVIHYNGNTVNRQTQKPVPTRWYNQWRVRLSRYPTWSGVLVQGWREHDARWIDVGYQRFDVPSDPGATLRIEIFEMNGAAILPASDRVRAMAKITGVVFTP